MESLYLACIGLLIFFSFSLLTKKKKAYSEKIFSFWIILLLLTVTTFYIYADSKAPLFPIFITLICDSHLLHGAFLLIYIKAFFDTDFKLKPKHLIHLVPMLVQVIAKLLLNLVFHKLECYDQGGCVEEEGNIYVTLTFIYKYLVLGFYIFLAWNEYHKFTRETHSPREVMRSQWIKQIVLGVFFLYLGVFLIQVGSYFFPNVLVEKLLLGNILTTLFILIFLYLGNSYAYLFVRPTRSGFSNLGEAKPLPEKTPKKGEPSVENRDVFAKVEAFMKEEQPFIQGQFKLSDLAEAIKIPQNQISQAINSCSGKNISDYVNTYRVELLKQKLADPENLKYKILILSDDCGFTSKTTLTRIFKQQTGLTPSEYRDKMNK